MAGSCWAVCRFQVAVATGALLALPQVVAGRWWEISATFATLVVGVEVPLAQTPQLELERRLQRRDPHLAFGACS